MEIKVTLVDGREVPVVLRRYTTGERNDARTGATKSKVNARTQEVIIDFNRELFSEFLMVASIDSPIELKSIEGVRNKLYPKDFDMLLEKSMEMNEVIPLENTPSVSEAVSN